LTSKGVPSFNNFGLPHNVGTAIDRTGILPGTVAPYNPKFKASPNLEPLEKIDMASKGFTSNEVATALASPKVTPSKTKNPILNTINETPFTGSLEANGKGGRGFGANITASNLVQSGRFVDNLVNRHLTKNTPEIPNPVLTANRKLNTKIGVKW